MTERMEPGDLVLVAVVPRRADLEIARVLGWYRIPLRHAPKVIAVDWLAFYQSGRARGIHTIARVRGHELTTRRDLFRDQPDHPRAAELYFKLQLGPVQTLSQPLSAARNQRLTFLYTTGEQFSQARDVADLVVVGEERRTLFRSLRERGPALDTARPARPTPGLDDILPWLGAAGS